MKQVPPALLPILRSDLQGRILALVLLAPERDFSIADLAREAGNAPYPTVQAEVTRLLRAGMLVSRTHGRNKLVRPDPSYPFLAPLTAMIVGAYGPLPVVAERIATLPGVSEVHIFGSWADRLSGTQGPFPQDVDVLVVGDPNRDDLLEAARLASIELGREVNTTRVSSRAWQGQSTPFLATIASRPLIPVRPPSSEAT